MIPDDMTSTNPGPIHYTEDQMKEMWPQAAGELRGFANALDRDKAGITAAQIRMAVQMANLYLASIMEKK